MGPSGCGITFAAASYLFVRPGLGQGLLSQLAELGVDTKDWQQQNFSQDCGRGRMLALDERRERFSSLERMGHRYGITVRACHCKNPELADSTCHIAGHETSQERANQVQGMLPF